MEGVLLLYLGGALGGAVMNRIVEKVNFPIPKQPKAKRVAA